MELMADYRPRTSDEIADETGFSKRSIQRHLINTFNYHQERMLDAEANWQTHYSLERRA